VGHCSALASWPRLASPSSGLPGVWPVGRTVHSRSLFEKSDAPISRHASTLRQLNGGVSFRLTASASDSAIAAWWDTDILPKAVRKMTLIEESCRKRDLRQSYV
jgi:hypothetical protein